MSIIVNKHITFIDSQQFYNGSLDTLASNFEAKHLKISIFSILTWIIYMDVLWDNIYLLVILNGSKTDKIKQKLMSKKSNSSTGYVLKVD